jgi:hypothetical protein
MTLFDAYLMVDWCADARLKTGNDSVWCSLLSRTSGGSTLSRISRDWTKKES